MPPSNSQTLVPTSVDQTSDETKCTEGRHLSVSVFGTGTATIALERQLYGDADGEFQLWKSYTAPTEEDLVVGFEGRLRLKCTAFTSPGLTARFRLSGSRLYG